MPFRIWVIGTRTSSAPAGKAIDGPAFAAGAAARGAGVDVAGLGAASAAGADAPPAALCLPTGWPVRWLSTKSETSSRVIRPPPPVPTIIAAVRPCSRSRRRTAGVMRASALPGNSWVARSSEPAGLWAGAVLGLDEAIGEDAAALVDAAG